MNILLPIAFNLLMGWCCSQVAQRRGRNPALWFCAGAFLGGLIALIVLYLLPPRRKLSAPTAELQATVIAPVLSIIDASHTDKLWYYLSEQKEQCGPMSFQALSKAKGEGIVQEHTFVWNEAMENWLPFKEVITESRGNP